MPESTNHDELLRKRFENFAAPPPANAFANIQKTLDTRRRNRFWRLIALAVAAILLLASIPLLFLRREENLADTAHPADSKRPQTEAPAPTRRENRLQRELPGTDQSAKDHSIDRKITDQKADAGTGTTGTGIDATRAAAKTPVSSNRVRSAGKRNAAAATSPRQPGRKTSTIKGKRDIPLQPVDPQDVARNKVADIPAGKNLVPGTQDDTVTTGDKDQIDMLSTLPVGLLALKKEDLCRLSSVSPVKERKIKQVQNFSVSLYLTPYTTYKHVQRFDNDTSTFVRLHNKNHLYSERVGYEAGITISRMLSSRFSLQTSVGLLNQKEKSVYSVSFGGDTGMDIETGPNNQTLILKPRPNLENHVVSGSYSYAMVSISGAYLLKENGSLSYSLCGGIGGGMLVFGRLQTGYPGVSRPSDETTLSLQKSNVYARLGFETAFSVSPGIQLLLEPNLAYFTGNSYKSMYGFSVKSYSIGLRLGIRFGKGNR